MRPNGRVRLTIEHLGRGNDPAGDLCVERTDNWPLSGWRPGVLAKIKRDEPMMPPVSMSGPTTDIDATIWIADFPRLRETVERENTEITVEFQESVTSPSTFWKVIHSRLEFATSLGIALDCKRRTDK